MCADKPKQETRYLTECFLKELTEEEYKELCKEAYKRQGVYMTFESGYDEISLNMFLENNTTLPVTSRTIKRYVNDGVVSRPAIIAMVNNQCSHALYHPFSVIEIITASHLINGDWLETKMRVPRLTSWEVFVGRAAFFANGGMSWLNEQSEQYGLSLFAGFSFNTSKYYFCKCDKLGDDNMVIVPRNEEYYVKQCHGFNLKKLEMQFGKDRAEISRSYYEMLYRSTFEYWYQKHIGDIVSNIPKTPPDFKGGGYYKYDSLPESKTTSTSEADSKSEAPNQ